MPVRPEREYRRIPIGAIESRQLDDGAMIVEGYATTFEQQYMLWEDSYARCYEVIDRRAFDEADMSDVIMQYDHKGRIFCRTKNQTLECKPDDHGLYIRGRLDGTDIGRQLYQEIKGGYTDKMSFGFTVSKGGDEWTQTEDESGLVILVRRILRFKKIYDVSACSIPANDATEISARSLFDGAIERVRAERLAAEQRARLALKIKIMMEV